MQGLPRTPKPSNRFHLISPFLSSTNTSLSLPFSSAVLPCSSVSPLSFSLPSPSVDVGCLSTYRQVFVKLTSEWIDFCLFSLHGAKSTAASTHNSSSDLWGHGGNNHVSLPEAYKTAPSSSSSCSSFYAFRSPASATPPRSLMFLTYQHLKTVLFHPRYLWEP